ncbi:MAG: cysteine desulfurase family protein [Patescibacteria group bacterium]
MGKLVYLDNNATTSVAPEVQRVITRALKEYANPSSLHAYGIQASAKLAEARARIAASIGALPDEIIFTASGSEGNALCIRGFAEANKTKGMHILTTGIEHPAVIQSCKHLEEQGFSVTYLGVDEEGFVRIEELEAAIRPDTILVSVMHVNNEIGTVQDLKRIVAVCTAHQVPVHTDAVQGFLKEPFNVQEIGVALATFAGHKVHAPKGIGFIYRRKGVKIRREIDGGSQELGLRAGTENIPYILGLAEAVNQISSKDIARMKELQAYLATELLALPQVRLNGTHDFSKRVCTNINIAFENIEAEQLLNKLSARGICVSTGSACSSKSTKTSPVLLGIHCPTEYIHGNLRISISRYTTRGEVQYCVKELKNILRSMNATMVSK